MKSILEENREHLVAGDSAFPISDVLIKPYPNEVFLKLFLGFVLKCSVFLLINNNEYYHFFNKSTLQF